MREPRFGRPAGPHKGTSRSERGDDERQAIADQDPPWMRFPREGVWINPANDEAWGGATDG